MIYLGVLCLLCLALLAYREKRYQALERELRLEIAQERQAWVRERHELNSRIQAPEAATYMFQPDEKDAEHDLPTLPHFTVDQDELDKARKHLEEAGYESGPAG